ncbi:hypothetical protein FRX31_032405 [Thalictrum thalictroides]|uniref:DUF4283 domain-containing protein n=1 Tax=Thalictrum thalictroides TaxID=46969 RepID=A0A7J6V0W0_THATH|nr:hypothetical protein FRX31_032405 [Thalictrum thalictroides]
MTSTPFGLGQGRNQSMYPSFTRCYHQNNKDLQAPQAEAVKSDSKLTYVKKAKQGCHPKVTFASLLTLGFKGYYPTFKIPSQAYERGLEYCKHCLIARIDLKDLTLEALKLQASQKLQPKGNWYITPSGKGFLHVRFKKREDFDFAWTGGPWRFGNQLMRLQESTRISGRITRSKLMLLCG